MTTVTFEPTIAARAATLRQEMEQQYDQARRDGKGELAFRCLNKLHQMLVFEAKLTGALPSPRRK